MYKFTLILNISAPIVPLTSVMSVDYLGLENLTNAHGMVSVGKGITSMITAPLAGKTCVVIFEI